MILFKEVEQFQTRECVKQLVTQRNIKTYILDFLSLDIDFQGQSDV